LSVRNEYLRKTEGRQRKPVGFGFTKIQKIPKGKEAGMNQTVTATQTANIHHVRALSFNLKYQIHNFNFIYKI
jgi:hypothetical protein